MTRQGWCVQRGLVSSSIANDHSPPMSQLHTLPPFCLPPPPDAATVLSLSSTSTTSSLPSSSSRSPRRLLAVIATTSSSPPNNNVQHRDYNVRWRHNGWRDSGNLYNVIDASLSMAAMPYPCCEAGAAVLLTSAIVSAQYSLKESIVLAIGGVSFSHAIQFLYSLENILRRLIRVGRCQ